MTVELGKNTSISKEMLDRFTTDFRNHPQHKILMSAIKKNGINAVAIDQDSSVAMQHTFSHEIITGNTSQSN